MLKTREQTYTQFQIGCLARLSKIGFAFVLKNFEDTTVVYCLQLLSSINDSPSIQWSARAVHNDQTLPYFTDQIHLLFDGSVLIWSCGSMFKCDLEDNIGKSIWPDLRWLVRRVKNDHSTLPSERLWLVRSQFPNVSKFKGDEALFIHAVALFCGQVSVSIYLYQDTWQLDERNIESTAF